MACLTYFFSKTNLKMVIYRYKNFPSLLVLLACFLLPLQSVAQLTDTTRVAIHHFAKFYEMENGFLGVRIPKDAMFNLAAATYTPAPLLSVIYRDGTASSNYVSYLQSPNPPTSMSDSILYETPDSCAILISYTFNKDDLWGPFGLIEAAGPGYFRVTLRMVKGEKACAVLEESDYEVGYDLKASDNLSPDKGRYEGHHSTSVANGYDINGNVYEKNDLTGYQATVDLSFMQRKNFPFTARWNPFVFNTGWHWQLYNSTAPSTANTFGIFDGRASQLLGVETSGVNIFTDAAAIGDIHSSCDVDGNCHFAWITEGQLWYKKIEADGTSASEVQVASGLVNPFVFSFGNTVNILALDLQAPAGSQIILMKKIGTGSFTTTTVSYDATIGDPFVYGASDGVHDFILFEGVRNGLGGFQLYSADFNTTSYTYADRLPNGSSTRSADRPDMKVTPQGNILVTYMANNAYQSYDVIYEGTTTFSGIYVLPFGTSAVTFGMNVDTRTGDFFWVKNDGSMHYVDLDEATHVATYSTSVFANVEHGAVGLPNRRSIATDGAGNAFAFHEGWYFYFDNTTKTWSWLSGSAWDAILPTCVYFSANTNLFYVVGKYQGQLARFSFNGSGNPVLVNTYPTTARPSAGVRSFHKRVAPTQNYYPDIRFEWCIFAGRKGTDLPAADQVQPIALTMHRVSGLANKLERYLAEPLQFEPAFDNGGLYMPGADFADIIDRVKTDNAFYLQMSAIDPYFIPIMDAWRDPSTTETTEVFQAITTYADNLKNNLTNGDGIYSFYFMYTTGANLMRRQTDLISALLADGKLSQVQEDSLKKIAGMFGRILWDNDFVPLFTEHGLSLGTANMPQTYSAQRWYYALILNLDPEFTARAATVPTLVAEVMSAQLNESGATRGSPHYLQPPMDLVAFTCLQMKNAGLQDMFTLGDTLHHFSDFILHLLTPPSVRFSGHRKLICFGDGSEESAAIFGLMATGFAGTDDDLSQRLMHAYRNGAARGSDFGFATMSINHGLLESPTPDLRNSHFPGYLSSLRAGIGTDYESSTMFIHGDWYFDHRNDDRGTISLYALGAPLSLNFGSFFYPSASGAHMKSTPVMLSEFPQWNQANQPFQLPNNQTWNTSQHDAFIGFSNSGYTKGTFTRGSETWTRKVYQFNPNVQSPFVVVKDEFSNPSTEYVSSFNFMASGTVSTPTGNVTPPPTLWNNNGGPFQSPSASSTFSLAPGMRKFVFTGRNWTAHPAGGIDFEVYFPSDSTNSACLAEWAHTYVNNTEGTEFQTTNGTSFEERQTILRLKGRKENLMLVVPYSKGQKPANLIATRSGDTLMVASDDFEFATDLNHFTYHDADKSVLATFDTQIRSFQNATVGNGPIELEITADTIVARLHGQSGVRNVNLPPGSWALTQPDPDATYSPATSTWHLNHVFVDSLVNSYGGGYSEFVFTIPIGIPVELKHFTATPDKQQVHLAWEAATETNLATYELQRSADARNYSKIAEKKAKGNNGSNIYSHDDPDVLPNTIYYYRLKMVDQDGSFAFSPVRTAMIGGDAEVKVVPNPVAGHFALSITADSDGEASVEILNANGQRVGGGSFPVVPGENSIGLDATLWPSGSYFAKITAGSKAWSVSFLK